ncbi:unnamed protein product [Pleuronectes platessa]|uniref:Uncharacterized protein n=1 Tax=Pleuronectes platessa TaxID=8262 RepID=A0A9N7UJX3_PLEPL|nr:unnamed protein product [Pleuronectes platessa]
MQEQRNHPRPRQAEAPVQEHPSHHPPRQAGAPTQEQRNHHRPRQAEALMQKRRGRIPFQEQEKFALFGPALTSVATTRPSGAPLKRPGLHSPNSEDSLTACTPRNTTRDSLDFPKIRATRASNTAKVTPCNA